MEKKFPEPQFLWVFLGAQDSSKRRGRKQNKVVHHDNDWCTFGTDLRAVASKKAGMAWKAFESCALPSKVQIPRNANMSAALVCCHDEMLQENSGRFARSDGAKGSIPCPKLLLPV